MDPLLIFAQLMLSVLGVLGVATSSPEDWPAQLARVGVALLLTYIVSRIKPKTVVKLSPWAYGSVLLLLIAVLFIGTSPAGSDSKRWILIGGFSLQPSELMKVTVIAYLTAFFHNHLGDWQIWRPMIVIGLAAGAIVAEPNVSTAAFIFLLAIAIMVAAGTSFVRLFSILTAAALIAVLLAGPYLSQFSYFGDRLSGWRDLWGAQEETQTTSYQALQARRALLKAGIFGIGPGRPVSVPAADTDMISISVAHALGLIGIISIFCAYFIIAGRGIRIASSLEGPGSLLAAGATTYLCGQAALNLLVASGLLPVTGIPLPFVSYGFNSLISAAIAMGFIHSSYRQAKGEGVAL